MIEVPIEYFLFFQLIIIIHKSTKIILDYLFDLRNIALIDFLNIVADLTCIFLFNLQHNLYPIFH